MRKFSGKSSNSKLKFEFSECLGVIEWGETAKGPKRWLLSFWEKRRSFVECIIIPTNSFWCFYFLVKCTKPLNFALNWPLPLNFFNRRFMHSSFDFLDKSAHAIFFFFSSFLTHSLFTFLPLFLLFFPSLMPLFCNKFHFPCIISNT